jgi:MoaA/NifB/PqqE/SkfB family radical SAM enzyme
MEAVLKNMMVELTTRCNRNCPICEANIPIRPDATMSAELGVRIVEALLESGIETVSFTGGEPTLCWDTLMAVLSCCSRLGVPTRLYSNGSGLDQGRIQELEGLLHDIVISLDSLNPGVVAMLRGTAGELERTIEIIRLLAGSRIRVFVISVCSAANLADLVPLATELRRWGIDGWWLQQYIPEGLGAKHSVRFAISRDTFERTVSNVAAAFGGPVRAFACGDEDQSRVFVDCDGWFIEYKTRRRIGPVLDAAIREKVLGSAEYRNVKRS